MKRISIFLCAIALTIACKKDAAIFNAEKVNVFYRLAVKDIDDQVTYSRVVSTKATTEVFSTDPGEGSGNDDSGSGQHYDGDGCDPNDSKFCSKHPWHRKCKLLPAVLEYITLKTNGNKVTVIWKASLEENVESYNVERSMDAVNFKTVGKVNPSGVFTNYEFVDEIK